MVHGAVRWWSEHVVCCVAWRCWCGCRGWPHVVVPVGLLVGGDGLRCGQQQEQQRQRWKESRSRRHGATHANGFLLSSSVARWACRARRRRFYEGAGTLLHNGNVLYAHSSRCDLSDTRPSPSLVHRQGPGLGCCLELSDWKGPAARTYYSGNSLNRSSNFQDLVRPSLDAIQTLRSSW
jgi:hypothetical protein